VEEYPLSSCESNTFINWMCEWHMPTRACPVRNFPRRGLSQAARPSPCMDVARRVVARWRAFVVARNPRPLLERLNLALLQGASDLNTLPQAGGCEEAEAADAAATAAAARPLAAPPPADEDVARRVVARWRAFVAARKPCPLLDLCQATLDLFEEEVLKRLDPTDRTMVAQVGRPWLAAVLASGLTRAGKRLPVGAEPLTLKAFCTSVERLAWAKDNGCPWVERTCALIAGEGCLEVLQWARERGCPWDGQTCANAALGGHMDVLQWARLSGCPWNERTCAEAARGGHLEVGLTCTSRIIFTNLRSLSC